MSVLLVLPPHPSVLHALGYFPPSLFKRNPAVTDRASRHTRSPNCIWRLSTKFPLPNCVLALVTTLEKNNPLRPGVCPRLTVAPRARPTPDVSSSRPMAKLSIPAFLWSC